jgi:crossover junction endodeoxyribonuclease RuvC
MLEIFNTQLNAGRTSVSLMLILGLDPGIAITGYGVIRSEKSKLYLIDYGVVRTPVGMTLPERLLLINNGLEEVIHKWKPETAAIEELFFNKNEKTALFVGHGRGVAILSAAKAGLPVYEYTPLQVKQAVTGYGRADKAQIQYMVRIMLGLTEIPKPDDAADALAIAICHANTGYNCNIQAKLSI